MKYFSLQKLLNIILINFSLSSVYHYSSFSLQTSTNDKKILKVLKNIFLLLRNTYHDFCINFLRNNLINNFFNNEIRLYNIYKLV